MLGVLSHSTATPSDQSLRARHQMALTVGPQVIVWVTLVFALVERSLHLRGATAGTRAWNPDDLPAPVQKERRGAAALASAVW